MDVFDLRNFQMNLFSLIVIWSGFGLDPHPDWIKTQQRAGSAYGFRKISGSGSRSGKEDTSVN
jgi:hypothetical protein